MISEARVDNSVVSTLWRHVALLVGVFFLLSGFGMVGSLVSMVLGARGQAEWVGWLAATYYIGLGIGSIRGEGVIARMGYLRAYGLLTASACLAMLLMVLIDHPLGWVIGRGLQGVALGGLFVCIESWLGSSAQRETRGQLLAVYQVVVYLGLFVGQGLLAGLASVPHTAFVVSAALVCLASLPVGMTNLDAPRPVVQPRLRLAALWSSSSLGMMAAVGAGIAGGSINMVTPAVATVAGFSVGEVAGLMSAFMAGALLLQVPVGWASDTFDRRRVLGGVAGLAALGAVASVGLLGQPRALMALSVLQGGVVFSIYGIALAYTLDRVPAERAISANAALLALYCVGSAGGSALSAWGLAAVGPVGFFVVIAAAAGGLCLTAVLASLVSSPVPAEARCEAVAVPNTSAALVELDPRVERAKRRAASQNPGLVRENRVQSPLESRFSVNRSPAVRSS